ncbi:MAG: hypothetical protein ACYSUH_01665 [Planctomycetota bacterium]|jgi:hypothetical protein
MKYQKTILMTLILLAGILATAIFRHDSHPAEDDGYAHIEVAVHNEPEDENKGEREECTVTCDDDRDPDAAYDDCAEPTGKFRNNNLRTSDAYHRLRQLPL